MEKFKKFEINKKSTIIGGAFNDPVGGLDWDNTVWAGGGEVGTDAYNRKYDLIYYY